MKKTFSFGAAPRSEKIGNAAKVNQCKEFKSVTVTAENAGDVTTHNDCVTFECDSFGIVEEYSTPGWNEVFSYEIKERRVIFRIPGSYILGKVIPGHH